MGEPGDTADLLVGLREALRLTGLGHDRLLELARGGALRVYRVDRTLRFSQQDLEQIAAGSPTIDLR